jgi:GNAT superfamily N-acetyltransferase
VTERAEERQIRVGRGRFVRRFGHGLTEGAVEYRISARWGRFVRQFGHWVTEDRKVDGRRQLHDLPSTPMPAVLDIQPLTPSRLPDLAALFEQGGDPKWCWCAYFRIRGFDFSSGGKARHRQAMDSAVDHNAREGRAPGLVAYDRGEAVGWTSIGPREDYERLAHSTVLKPIDDRPVWSIVCFVVGRRSRGRGVARALLDAGIDYARDHGATMLEAYPVEVAGGERIRPADAFRGTVTMFERAGFKVVERRAPSGKATPRLIVRRAIRPRRPPRAR